MNATSTPEHTDTVPRQRGRVPDASGADLPVHADPTTAAHAAAAENLLRCWAREKDLAAPGDDTLRIPLPASGTALLVPVRYWSPIGWHRFGPPHLAANPLRC